MEIIKLILLSITGLILVVFVGGLIVHIFSTIFWKAGLSEIDTFFINLINKTRNEEKTK